MQQEKKIDKPTIYLAVILAVASVFILYKEVFLKRRLSSLSIFPQNAKFTVNFQIFDQKNFKELILVKKISLPKKFGRSNPFVPYQLSPTEETITPTSPVSTSTSFLMPLSTELPIFKNSNG